MFRLFRLHASLPLMIPLPIAPLLGTMTLLSALAAHAQDTTTYQVGDLPVVGNERTIELATVHMRENSADAWQDGTFTLLWSMTPNADMRLHLQDSSLATGSVTQPTPVVTGPYWITFEVDAEDDRIDTITLEPLAHIDTDSYLYDLTTGTSYYLQDGQPSPTSAGGYDWREIINHSNVTDTDLTLGRFGETFELTAGRETTIQAGVTFTRTIRTATGQSSAPYSAEGSLTNLEVSTSGEQLTVTGLAPAERQPVQVVDDLNRRDYFFITVLEDGALPPVEAVAGIDGSASSATMEIGASPDWEPTYLKEFLPGEDFTVSAVIEPEADHVGLAGELFVVIYLAPAQGNPQWYYQDGNGAFYPWDGDVTTLPAAEVTNALSSREALDIYSGALPVGSYSVYVGYMAEQGTLIYSQLPHEVSVVEALHDPQ